MTRTAIALASHADFTDAGAGLYYAFLHEIAHRTQAGAVWQDVAAGLVVMRMADAWLSGEDPEQWGLQAAFDSLAGLDEDSAEKRILPHVLSVLTSPPGPTTVQEVVKHLATYARALEHNTSWNMAIDVYRWLLRNASRTDHEGRVVLLIRLGFCQRSSNALTSAARTYRRARRYARLHRDRIGVLRAWIGTANLAFVRGDLPRAVQILDKVIKCSSREGLNLPLARALHDRGNLALHWKQFSESLEYLYRALRLTEELTERQRILSDIGVALLYFGLYEPARRVLMAVSTGAADVSTRWVGLFNLLELESFVGSLQGVQKYEREISQVCMSPHRHSTFLLGLGQAYARLGNAHKANEHLSAALALAAEHGLNQLLIEAEESQRAAGQPASRPPNATPHSLQPLIDEIESIAPARPDAPGTKVAR